jgi:hypothetical protein
MMQRWWLIPIVALATPAAGAALRARSGAQIFFSDKVTVEFAPGKVPKEAAWNDQMELTSRGLATLQPWAPNSSRDFWFRTQPIAGGPSWRPPRVLGITVDLQGIEFAPNSTMRPYIRAFARYSTDRVHWSSWFGLTGKDSTLAPETFTGSLSMPQQAQAKYSELMTQWWRTNPAWSSDEHEFCLWLAANHRDYFATEIPVMGYVQILVEGGAHLRIAGLSVALSSSASGLQSIPRGERRATADRNWFFDLATIGR